MPLDETVIDLQAEYDRLDAEVAEHAQDYHDAAPGTEARRIAAEQGKRAERHRDGIAWALGYPDTEATGAGWDAESVTLSALTVGDQNLMYDQIEKHDWDRQVCYVAAVTADAPYLEHDPEATDPDDYRETVRNVVELKPAFVSWVETRAERLSRAGDSGNSFLESVQAIDQSTNSQTENG